MKIKSIEIKEIEYGEQKGNYFAEAKLRGGRSYPADVAIPIPEELLTPIVQLLMRAVASTMAKATEEFSLQVEQSLQAGVLLEHEGDDA